MDFYHCMRLTNIFIVIMVTATLSLVFHSAAPRALEWGSAVNLPSPLSFQSSLSDFFNTLHARVTALGKVDLTPKAFAQLDPPFNAAQPRTYFVCSGNACVKKIGKGISQCRTDSDCATQRTACVGNTCMLVTEPGEDECTLGVPCDAVSHKTCVNYGVGPQCVAIPGGPKPDEVTCDDTQDCIDANIPPIREFPTFAPLNFCGANGQPCQCTAGKLPIDPGLIKSFNTLVHAEKIPAFSGFGPTASWANRWQECGSPLCAVDLKVGSTAAEAYQTALGGVPVFSPINGVVRKVYTLEGGYGQCIVIGVN